jgi:glycosyltransferase involved in cell wall biosynthesis
LLGSTFPNRTIEQALRVAIVHDALVNLGGAERVLCALHEIFPRAPIFTSVYLPERTHGRLRTAEIHTTLLQKLAKTESQLKLLFPLTFSAMRRLDLSAFDVVISSSTYCAKNVEHRAGSRHICYCYAPFRPVWDYDEYTANLNWSPITRWFMRACFQQFRHIDFKAAQKPDHIIAISKYASAKLVRAYGRKPSAIIYPPVDVSSYRYDCSSEGYFLVVSRLLAYKRIDIVIEAFNRLRIPLKIVGTGPDQTRLRKMAAPNVEFLNTLPESDLRDYYARCRCLVFPGAEDFGLTPLEAHASGKPVIAFAGGGATETVVGWDPEVADSSVPPTGLFFHQQSSEAVVDALRRFEKIVFDRNCIRQRAMLFDKANFRANLSAFVSQVHNQSQESEMWSSAQAAPTQERACGEYLLR